MFDDNNEWLPRRKKPEQDKALSAFMPGRGKNTILELAADFLGIPLVDEQSESVAENAQPVQDMGNNGLRQLYEQSGVEEMPWGATSSAPQRMTGRNHVSPAVYSPQQMQSGFAFGRAAPNFGSGSLNMWLGDEAARKQEMAQMSGASDNNASGQPAMLPQQQQPLYAQNAVWGGGRPPVQFVNAQTQQEQTSNTWEKSGQYPFRNVQELLEPDEAQKQFLKMNGYTQEQLGVSTGMTNLRSAPQRLFETDFPGGNYQFDSETGRMKTDVDGREIHSDAVIVGRAVYGQPDISFSKENLDKVHRGLTGQDIAYTVMDNGRVVGYYRDSEDGENFTPITMNSRYYQSGDKFKEAAIRAERHEMGHLFDDIIGTLNDSLNAVPVDVLRGFYDIYNEQKNPYLGFERLRYPQASADDAVPWNGFTPASLGYNTVNDETRGLRDHTRRELYAEAVRAYLTDPNAMKAHYPEVAKYLRDMINTNPRLNKYLHLSDNSGNINANPYFLLEKQIMNT